MAVLVVIGTFLGIGKDFIGFIRFLEFLFRVLVIGIDVGVILLRKLPESFLDLTLVRIARNAKHFVIIAFSCQL